MTNILTKRSARVETGALTINSDWPGLFIRGDDCIQLKFIFEHIDRKEPLDLFEQSFLNSLHDEIINFVLIKHE